MINSRQKRVVLSMVLGMAAMAAAVPALAAPPCSDCLKHLGNDANLMERQGTQSIDTPNNSLWGGNTSSTPLRAGTDSTMLKTGTESTMLKTGTESTMLQTGTKNTTLEIGTQKNVEPLAIEILIDCSQSMKEGLGNALSKDGHEPKMEAAKKVLEETMATIPSDVSIGLRVFGQSFRNDPYLDCQQTALLVPIGTHNRRAVVERIRQMRPYGLTPLTFALEQAAADLSQFGGRKQIILISDGAETCGLDPCAMIHSLTERGFNMKIDIVGLGLKHDNEAKIQLNCIANQTGGKFYDSNTAAELVDNLRKITAESKVAGKVITRLKSDQAKDILGPNLPK